MWTADATNVTADSPYSTADGFLWLVVGLTGTAATASVGEPGIGIGLTGVAATTGISITVPTTVLALTGVAATVSIGEIGIGIGLTGVSGTGAAGNVSIPVNGVLTREASRYEFLRTAQSTTPT